MQDYNQPGDIITKIGTITSAQFQTLNSIPVQLNTAPLGSYSIFINLSIFIEAISAYALPITFVVTNIYSLAYGQLIGENTITIPNASIITIFPSIPQNTPSYETGAPAQNYFILGALTDDAARDAIIKYKLTYQLFTP